MKSNEHAVAGAVASVLAARAVADDWPLPARAALVGYGLLLSVFIDLDHFVIARLKVGDWSHLQRCLSDPVWAFTDQGNVFPDIEITVQRLFTHALIGVALVFGLLLVSPVVALFTAAVVSVHVACDLLREIGLA